MLISLILNLLPATSSIPLIPAFHTTPMPTRQTPPTARSQHLPKHLSKHLSKHLCSTCRNICAAPAEASVQQLPKHLRSNCRRHRVPHPFRQDRRILHPSGKRISSEKHIFCRSRNLVLETNLSVNRIITKTPVSGQPGDMFDKNTASDKSVRFRSRGFKTEYYSYLSSMAFIAIVKELFSTSILRNSFVAFLQ